MDTLYALHHQPVVSLGGKRNGATYFGFLRSRRWIEEVSCQAGILGEWKPRYVIAIAWKWPARDVYFGLETTQIVPLPKH